MIKRTPSLTSLRTPARRPAIEALVARAIPHHDRAAVAAARRVLLETDWRRQDPVRRVGVLGWHHDRCEILHKRSVVARHRDHVRRRGGRGGGLVALDHAGALLLVPRAELDRQPLE